MVVIKHGPHRMALQRVIDKRQAQTEWCEDNAVRIVHEGLLDLVGAELLGPTWQERRAIKGRAVKHPEVEISWFEMGNSAGEVMRAVTGAMRRARVPAHEIERYYLESMSGSYDNLLATVLRWVTVRELEEA